MQDEYAPEHLRERVRALKEKGLAWRCSLNDKAKATPKDVEWAIREAKDLLIEIDRFHGVPVEKGDWE